MYVGILPTQQQVCWSTKWVKRPDCSFWAHINKLCHPESTKGVAPTVSFIIIFFLSLLSFSARYMFCSRPVGCARYLENKQWQWRVANDQHVLTDDPTLVGKSKDKDKHRHKQWKSQTQTQRRICNGRYDHPQRQKVLFGWWPILWYHWFILSLLSTVCSITLFNFLA